MDELGVGEIYNGLTNVLNPLSMPTFAKSYFLDALKLFAKCNRLNLSHSFVTDDKYIANNLRC